MQYLQKNVGDEVHFLLADKHQRILQMKTIILGVCVARHIQITQNNFSISLQYSNKDVSDGVDFLQADKHENFLQIDTMIFDGDGQIFSKFPK